MHKTLVIDWLPCVQNILQPCPLDVVDHRHLSTCILEVCGSSISATRPVPVPDDAYPLYPTRAENCYPTRPDPTRGYTRTRSLPVGLPLLGIIGLMAYPRPVPLHCITSDESIFCCGEHVLHASS